jgi:hypothetical protein
MLGFGPISSSAISALPDYLLSALSIVFTGEVIYEAVPASPYVLFVNGETRKAYAIELNLRAVRF